MGQFLKKIRMELGLQIKQAEKLSGLKDTAIISWETGNRKPKRENLKKLLECYKSKGTVAKDVVRIMNGIE